CLPGGKMAVYTGLVPVARNEDAMAVVMGHEIAHALLRHGAQRMAQQKLSQMGQMAGAMSGMDPQQQQMVMAAMGYGYLLPYARKHETEADYVGLMLAAAACYDPREAVPLWERMSEASGGQAPPEFQSTHPNPGTRIQNLQSLMPKALEFYAQYCGTPGCSCTGTGPRGASAPPAGSGPALAAGGGLARRLGRLAGSGQVALELLPHRQVALGELAHHRPRRLAEHAAHLLAELLLLVEEGLHRAL